MITLTREEAQQVLDALENKFLFMASDCAIFARAEAMKTLRAKLSEPEIQLGITYEEANQPEPVAYRARVDGMWFTAEKKEKLKHELNKAHINADIEPLYTAPPQREWVGLTDEEIVKVFDYIDFKNGWLMHFYRAIEAKLKELSELR